MQLFDLVETTNGKEKILGTTPFPKDFELYKASLEKESCGLRTFEIRDHK